MQGSHLSHVLSVSGFYHRADVDFVKVRLPVFCLHLRLSFFRCSYCLGFSAIYRRLFPLIQSKLLSLEILKSRAFFQSLSPGFRDLPLWSIAYRWVSSTVLWTHNRLLFCISLSSSCSSFLGACPSSELLKSFVWGALIPMFSSLQCVLCFCLTDDLPKMYCCAASFQNSSALQPP